MIRDTIAMYTSDVYYIYVYICDIDSSTVIMVAYVDDSQEVNYDTKS
jgi:hypothetical protein